MSMCVAGVVSVNNGRSSSANRDSRFLLSLSLASSKKDHPLDLPGCFSTNGACCGETETNAPKSSDSCRTCLGGATGRSGLGEPVGEARGVGGEKREANLSMTSSGSCGEVDGGRGMSGGILDKGWLIMKMCKAKGIQRSYKISYRQNAEKDVSWLAACIR